MLAGRSGTGRAPPPAARRRSRRAPSAPSRCDVEAGDRRAARRWAGGASSACAPSSTCPRRSGRGSRRSRPGSIAESIPSTAWMSLNGGRAPRPRSRSGAGVALAPHIGEPIDSPRGRVRRATLEGASMTPTTNPRTTAAARGLGLVPPRARGDHARALRAAAARARPDAERLRGAAAPLACRRAGCCAASTSPSASLLTASGITRLLEGLERAGYVCKQTCAVRRTRLATRS